MKSTVITLGACAIASLAMVGWRSLGRLRRDAPSTDFCPTGLFV
ncbi:MAG: hypothetical protein R2834_24175 [Rhodothermales bacterium]